MRLSTKVLPSGCLSLTNSGCAALSFAATGLPSLSRKNDDTRTVSPGRYKSRPDHANTSNQADSRPETANSDSSSPGWLNGSSETSLPRLANSTWLYYSVTFRRALRLQPVLRLNIGRAPDRTQLPN